MTHDIFDGLFDFNFDGKTDTFELALGLQMIHEDEQKSLHRCSGHADLDLDDLGDLDSDDSDDLDGLGDLDPDDF